MTTATLTLTEFLLARIAEDEAAARAAIDSERPGSHWRWFNADDTVSTPDPDTSDEYLTYPASLRTIEEYPTVSVGSLPAFLIAHAEEVMTGAGLHIARHDPARVLAECEAKRRIVEIHEHWHRWNTEGLGDAAQMTLELLALPYSDHPDYREEWRP